MSASIVAFASLFFFGAAALASPLASLSMNIEDAKGGVRGRVSVSFNREVKAYVHPELGLAEQVGYWLRISLRHSDGRTFEVSRWTIRVWPSQAGVRPVLAGETIDLRFSIGLGSKYYYKNEEGDDVFELPSGVYVAVASYSVPRQKIARLLGLEAIEASSPPVTLVVEGSRLDEVNLLAGLEQDRVFSGIEPDVVRKTCLRVSQFAPDGRLLALEEKGEIGLIGVDPLLERMGARLPQGWFKRRRISREVTKGTCLTDLVSTKMLRGMRAESDALGRSGLVVFSEYGFSRYPAGDERRLGVAVRFWSDAGGFEKTKPDLELWFWLRRVGSGVLEVSGEQRLGG